MLLYSSYYKNKKLTRGAVWWRRTAHIALDIGGTSTTLTYQIKVIVVAAAAAAALPLANGCVPSTAPAVAVHLGCHARQKKRKEHE